MTYLADLHIHVGINEDGKWIKIPSTKKLTVRNILKAAKDEIGLDVVGIIDALSPLVQKDVKKLIQDGELTPLAGGGYMYQENLLLVLGGEVETRETNGGLAHSLLFLPTVEEMLSLSRTLSKHIKNINMSSQNAHMTLAELYDIAFEHSAKIIPAHVFTPFKSVYGNCTDKITHILPQQEKYITAIELGLSSDTFLADRIDELSGYNYLTNSDAHSLQNIAREFNKIDIKNQLDYKNLFLAIEGKEGAIVENYGLNPAMGKYYLTRCADCGSDADFTDKKCKICGGRIVRGVKERIDEIADRPFCVSPEKRAKYRYHMPLCEIPGIGKKAIDKICFEKFTQLEVLYDINEEKLQNLLGKRAAANIMQIRSGDFSISGGGAGKYGYVIIN